MKVLNWNKWVARFFILVVCTSSVCGVGEVEYIGHDHKQVSANISSQTTLKNGPEMERIADESTRGMQEKKSANLDEIGLLENSSSSTSYLVSWLSANDRDQCPVNTVTNISRNSTILPKRVRKKFKVSCLPFNRSLWNRFRRPVYTFKSTDAALGFLYYNPEVRNWTTPSNCTVFLFYGHWCPWSAAAAPHFNALRRAFPSVQFAAVDVSYVPKLLSLLGIYGIPTISLFWNGRLIARFNGTGTDINLERLARFVMILTDQTTNISKLNLTTDDYKGPVSSIVTVGHHDWILKLAWTFIIISAIYYGLRSEKWRQVRDMFGGLWREAEAVADASQRNNHYHQD